VLPQYDVSALHSVQVHASAERIYSVLQRGFPMGVVSRFLLTIRDIPRLFRRKKTPALPENAFCKLKQLENREIVVGIIGQFWKPVPEPVIIHGLEDFLRFQHEGFCKAAMNFRIREEPRGHCVVSTETRVIGYGGRAKARFREYWSLIGPFSSLIRREILRKIKSRAERKESAEC